MGQNETKFSLQLPKKEMKLSVDLKAGNKTEGKGSKNNSAGTIRNAARLSDRKKGYKASEWKEEFVSLKRKTDKLAHVHSGPAEVLKATEQEDKSEDIQICKWDKKPHRAVAAEAFASSGSHEHLRT